MTPRSSERSDITLVFDGGAIGNPGAGYGSFALYGEINTPTPQRITFPGRTTNNQAEYLTLITALQTIRDEFKRRGKPLSEVSVEMLSDSMLVVEQVNGRWKIRKAELRPRVEEALELLRQFRSWSLVWHPRSESVRILGH